MEPSIVLHTTGTILNTFVLEPRTSLFPSWIFYIILVSLAIISGVRLINMNYFHYLWQGLLKNNLLQIEYRSGSNAAKRGSLLLTVNYLTSSTILIYMLIRYLEMEKAYYFLLLPLVLFSYHHFTLFITGILTGELKKLKEIFILNTITYQWFGLLTTPTLLIWLLHPENSSSLLLFIGIIFGLLNLIRIFKCFLKALQNKLPWYYIILYFCTVEIWPVLFVL